MYRDTSKRLQFDRGQRAFRYYRNAVERHWDPSAVDLSADVDGLVAMVETDPEYFDQFRAAVAKFGAGEQAVTEDLAPLAVVLEESEAQMFVTTQLYEEAKHADFFDRYWREVVHAVEDDRGIERSSPMEPRWFNDGYDELFERNDAAMDRLLTEDTPENRAKAFCHYHLTVEGILAQTGYYGLQRAYGPDNEELPTLPGLVEGLDYIRRDEGRHVGFGMTMLKDLVAGGVDPQLLHDTVGELLPLVDSITTDGLEADGPAASPDELRTYAAGKHTQRMKQITVASEAIPDVDQLTSLESD
ncbi:ribonucleotide-diphosphate reductase subunit beta [Halomarina oriensis]|uniref:Ribonucleoside-diphosphate reductase n=1 Tax=Halomarina oriensis TaxID=671145 RepID=A0A6B0GMU7_9EURY|nr:ribonucleotide-diphosphate reductase subunit beta [Halomarina oriensis]MWG35990.1 ribonucleoside-diphosphate reductase [Halomarina oriensis]